MATSPTSFFPQSLLDAEFALVNGSGTTVQTIVAAQANAGCKIESLIATSTDTSSHDIQIFKTVSAVNYLLGTVSVPAGAGNTSGVPSVNVLANLPGLPVDANGNPYIYMGTGTSLSAGAVVTVTSGKDVYLSASAGVY